MRRSLKRKKNTEGYIALLTVIILSFILMSVVLSTSQSGFFARFTVLDSENKETSFYRAKSCTHIAALKLSIDPRYLPKSGGDSVLLSYSDETALCTIVSIEENSGEITIRTKANAGDAVTNLETSLVKDGGAYEILSQTELPAFP